MPEWHGPNLDTSEELSPQVKSCAQLPIPLEYWSLAGEPAFVDVPHRDTLEMGDTVCVRVIVPPKTDDAGGEQLEFMPFTGSPWDSIMLNLVGQDTGVSVPVRLAMASHTYNYQRGWVHIYEANVRLYDVDTYTAEGYIEYRNALWNPNEEFMEPQPFEPEPLAIDSDIKIAVQGSTNGNGIYALERYLDLPLCTEADNDGRWVSVDQLPFDPLLVPEPDNHNLVWLPYDCRLKRYSYPEFAQCMVSKHKLVHWMGDSNTRRALKKISTLGQWCSTPEQQQSIECTCNDNQEAFAPYNANGRITPFNLFADKAAKAPTNPKDYSSIMPNRTRIISIKWDGLSRKNNPPWRDYLQPDVQKNMGDPSLLVLGALSANGQRQLL
ncbi:hypothetical protein GGF46_004831 [Coemansia sp. RSA 552]|nr:hypothetical protein GGF46_004831 [Coemansia sp. RSA 552]